MMVKSRSVPKPETIAKHLDAGPDNCVCLRLDDDALIKLKGLAGQPGVYEVALLDKDGVRRETHPIDKDGLIGFLTRVRPHVQSAHRKDLEVAAEKTTGPSAGLVLDDLHAFDGVPLPPEFADGAETPAAPAPAKPKPAAKAPTFSVSRVFDWLDKNPDSGVSFTVPGGGLFECFAAEGGKYNFFTVDPQNRQPIGEPHTARSRKEAMKFLGNTNARLAQRGNERLLGDLTRSAADITPPTTAAATRVTVTADEVLRYLEASPGEHEFNVVLKGRTTPQAPIKAIRTGSGLRYHLQVTVGGQDIKIPHFDEESIRRFLHGLTTGRGYISTAYEPFTPASGELEKIRRWRDSQGSGGTGV